MILTQMNYINMNRYEQETHNNIKRIAVALEQLAKLLTKLAKEQND